MDRTRTLTLLLALLAIFSAGTLVFALFSYRSYQELLQEMAAQESVQPVESSEPVVLPPVVLQQGVETSEEVAGLNEYIAKLEEQNRTLRQQLSSASSQQQNARPEFGGGRRRHGGPPDMEKLKESDPERYEEFQKRRQEMDQRRQEQRQRRQEYLSSVNTSRLSQSQKETLQNYKDLLSEMDEDTQGGPPDFDRMREMMDMREEVQEILYQDLGDRLGTDGQALYESVQELQSVMGGNGGPRGGGPGGGMPPGPPPQ